MTHLKQSNMEIIAFLCLFQLYYIGWKLKDVVIELRWANRMKENELKTK